MAKIKTKYVCSDCGHESPKWWGICPECKSGGTMVEETVAQSGREIKPPSFSGSFVSKAVPIGEVAGRTQERMLSGISELDRVLGGGIVKGSMVLIGGDPGIGKSTLLIQMAYHIAGDKKVLYISGEESKMQIKMRASRLFSEERKILLVSETQMDMIEGEILAQAPDVVIIDSIQTVSNPQMTSLPGSVGQVREATGRLMRIAKSTGTACFIVGHVTKEGAIAGPKVLEHLVDTVLYFEGERFHAYRMIRAVKNRFGSTNELGVFEMTDRGLREVRNPSELLLSENSIGAPGTAIVCTMEGTRPLLLEIQALTAPTGFPMPRRTATGIDINRLHMLTAVLERRANFKVLNQDIYVNLTGGMRIAEPSVDIGILCAMASSLKNREIKEKAVLFGEVGLTGEIRSVSFAQNRILEAKNAGFEEVILPKSCLKSVKKPEGIRLTGVGHIKEALSAVFSA